MPTQLQIPIEQVRRRLEADNPWWAAGGGIDPEQRRWPRRAYFASFMRLVRETAIKRASVLFGPRRVGKTVMLMHAIQALLDDEVSGLGHRRPRTSRGGYIESTPRRAGCGARARSRST
jgi:uncharacterized protein